MNKTYNTDEERRERRREQCRKYLRRQYEDTRNDPEKWEKRKAYMREYLRRRREEAQKDNESPKRRQRKTDEERREAQRQRNRRNWEQRKALGKVEEFHEKRRRRYAETKGVPGKVVSAERRLTDRRCRYATNEERLSARREMQRKRYREDPEYREKKKRKGCEYRARKKAEKGAVKETAKETAKKTLTVEEEQFLTDNYDKRSLTVIGQALGVTPTVLSTYVDKLKLKDRDAKVTRDHSDERWKLEIIRGHQVISTVFMRNEARANRYRKEFGDKYEYHLTKIS